MDIYEDRSDWQMSDHVNYNTPLEWPENVFGEELGGGTPDPIDDPTDDDDVAAVPPAEHETAMGMEDEDDEADGPGAI